MFENSPEVPDAVRHQGGKVPPFPRFTSGLFYPKENLFISPSDLLTSFLIFSNSSGLALLQPAPARTESACPPERIVISHGQYIEKAYGCQGKSNYLTDLTYSKFSAQNNGRHGILTIKLFWPHCGRANLTRRNLELYEKPRYHMQHYER